MDAKQEINFQKIEQVKKPITLSAKQKSLGDLNFFFQPRPKNNSTFSNFAKQTRSFYK
jgi:hypothetical protein